MEVFSTFRKIRSFLRATAFAIFLANLQGAWATTYTWTGAGTDNNWTTPANWDLNSGYPSTTDDTARFPGTSVSYVTLDKNIKISAIQSHYVVNANKELTIDLNNHTLELIYRYLLVNTNGCPANTQGNVILTNTGELKTDTFDFPSEGNHKFKIENTDTKLTITATLWANSDGTLEFSGDGYLYLPNGGANVNYGPTNIIYSIPASHRLPYASGNPTYLCGISFSSESTPDGATITFTKGLPNEGSSTIKFPYSVKIVGTNTTYTLNSQTLSDGDVYTGDTASSPTGTSDMIISGGNSNEYTLSCTSSSSFSSGDGITIIFYSPDGQLPSDSTSSGTKSFMEIGRLSWYYQKPTWTGKGSDSNWTTRENWTGISGISNLKDLSAYDIEISIQTSSSDKKPEISDEINVKSLTITGGSQATLKSGKIITNKIATSGTGKFISEDGTTVELRKDTVEPVLAPAFANSITIKNLSIGEGSSFEMPFDMDLGMLTLNSGASFSKNGCNLTLGWLQIQTANYSNPRLTDDARHITLTEDFEADSIIILLRDGNIIAQKTLTARKDFIIGGANYNYSIIKYDSFTTRPSTWVPSYTDTTLKLSDGVPRSESSAFYLSLSPDTGEAAHIKAGTSGKGNFYINGANLIGEGNNKIFIPQNDSAENFCADAIFSTIANITVVCSDDDSEDGSKSQIPTGGCTLTNCNNFDSTDFEIVSAETVADDRIKVVVSAPARNTQGELNYSTALNAIKVSDGNSFTAVYNSKTGTSEPEATPTEFYLYTEKTNWNTDATGLSEGNGNYTNAEKHGAIYKTVKPYLVIPQYASSGGSLTCGYVITDKWGKRMNSYSPDSNAFKNVTDGIPDNEKTKRLPPIFSVVLSPVNSSQIVICFSKPIVTESSKISYYADPITPIQITQSMNYILPRCFEIISIDSSGNPITSDIQINKNKNAVINTYSSGLSSITLNLTRKVTLSDIKNLYIRLITPKKDDGTPLYEESKIDPVTKVEGLTVSFIQQSDAEHTSEGGTFMQINTAHTISDFALGAVAPMYAYTSKNSENDISTVYTNVYGENSAAVHDFSREQKNYGTLSFGYGVSLLSKATCESTSDSSSKPDFLKLLVTDTPDSDSLFNIFNKKYDQTSYAWLPYFNNSDFHHYQKAGNTHYWILDQSSSNSKGYLFEISQESFKQVKPGTQISFLYALCDSSGTVLEHYLDPTYNPTNEQYTLTAPNPLFALNQTNSSDTMSLDVWYITLKSITEQRGGVTILNNVINAANGEKTVLKVNMPSSGNLDVMVMTLDGNIVKYLTHGSASAGEHFYYWDGKNNAGSAVARGMYFVIVKAPGIDETRKVMVVK